MTSIPLADAAALRPAARRTLAIRITLAAALAGLIVAALLAAAGVLVAGATAAAMYRRRQTSDPLTGLERALALARDAERRPAPDRRRALELLARLLGSRDPSLADEAGQLAWSEPAPTPDALEGLVADVEEKVR